MNYFNKPPECYPSGLRYGQTVKMVLSVNNQAKEEALLTFIGWAGDWLHFQNGRTKENHLVKEYQFPRHTWKMGECQCKLSYDL